MGANAQTTVPTFTAAQVLTADQMNQSARTGVPVFADATARDAGFGGSGEKVLAEGQLCYLESTNVVQYYDGAAWATVGPTSSGLIQVKSTSKTDTFTTTSTSLVDVTGLSVSITPTSASNKILVSGYIMIGNTTNNSVGAYVTLLRGATAIGIGDAAGSRSRITADVASSANNAIQGSVAFMFLDSPATTSATTYKLQMRSQAGGTVAVNRSIDDTDSAIYTRAASSITVMEVLP
jgi:hypothetical protein